MGTTVFPGTTAMRNFIVVLALSLLAPGFAQAADPPGRVARLSLIEGEVSMAPAGTQEWGEAVLNRPLTSEDRLFVARDARAELQVGSATIHLDSSTEFSFIDLDDDAMTMSLTEGRATIRILNKREREDIEISTPNASVALLHPGEYHVEVDEDGETTVVKARSGEAEVAGEADAFRVRANEIGVFSGAEELKADITRLGPRTAFEAWANERARRNERSASSKYVGEGVVGYTDLDEHGHWINEPEYGHVWYPTHVAAGWAPYRYGRWAWVSPWGWTWIDDARWGFAPFHYGRWAYVRHRWCWVPGPRHVRAVYAPALVAWVGGPHVSVNISLGHGVGWFPLGPREVYVPGYWHTRRYIRRVNVSNTIIVNNTYINNAYRGRYRDLDYRYRNRSDAVTVVEREHFVRGRPIGGHVARVNDGDLRRWGHDARPPAIAPRRESILAGQPRVARAPSVERDARHVVARRAVPTRVSFDAERRAIEANGGRPVARTALIDRNPKSRSDVRIVRGTSENARSRSINAGAAPRVPSAAEGHRTSRDTAERASDSNRSQALRERRFESRERDTSGQAIQRMPASEDRAPRQRESPSQRTAPSIERRIERSNTPEREARPRIERSYSAPERQSQPRIERARPSVEAAQPRVERSPRIERAQPRVERSQPRTERSQGNSSSGRASHHMRVERGGSTRER